MLYSYSLSPLSVYSPTLIFVSALKIAAISIGVWLKKRQKQWEMWSQHLPHFNFPLFNITTVCVHMFVCGEGAVNLGIERKKSLTEGSNREWSLRKDMAHKLDTKQNKSWQNLYAN